MVFADWLISRKASMVWAITFTFTYSVVDGVFLQKT